MPNFRRNMLALLVLLSLPAGATDYTVEYGDGPPPAPISGRLNDDMLLGDVDPIFHRPLSSFDGSCAEVGYWSNNYRYDTITLTNTRDIQVYLDLAIDTGSCSDYHSVLYGYSPSFFPDDPNRNCLVYDDDGLHGDCSLLSTALAPNQMAVFVVTSYSSDETWSWTATFNDRLLDSGFEYTLSP